MTTINSQSQNDRLISTMELSSINNLPIGYIITNVAHDIVLINYAARELMVETKEIVTLEEVVAKLPERLGVFDHVKYCSLEHKSCDFR